MNLFQIVYAVNLVAPCEVKSVLVLADNEEQAWEFCRTRFLAAEKLHVYPMMVEEVRI